MFNYEKELVEKFIDLKKIGDNSITECPFRWGSIDLVEYKLDSINYLNEEQIKYLKNKENMMIFSRLYKKKGHSINFLASHTNLTENIVKNRLEKMIELKICESLNNLYLINNDVKFPDIIVKGYEMKLNDIKKAINQAVINKKYCDYSYIVFPFEKYNMCMEYKELLKDCAIGLILVDNKCVREIIRPKKLFKDKGVKLKSKIFILDYLSTLNVQKGVL